MSEQENSSSGGHSLSTATMGPRTAFTVSGCAVLVTATYLGAEWPAVMWLGLPAGVWVLGGGLAALHLHLGRRDQSFSTDLSEQAGQVRSLASSAGDLLRRWSAGQTRRAGELALRVHDRFILPRTGSIAALQPRLRIGLDLPLGEVRAVLDNSPLIGADDLRVEWVRVEAGREDAADCRRCNLDALIRRHADETIRIVTPEYEGYQAAWPDWGRRQLLGYASLFPTRIDPAQVSLGNVSLKDDVILRLVMRLAACGAILSRSPARLRVRDRLTGRAALTPDAATAPDPQLVRRWMLDLTQSVQTAAADSAQHRSESWRAAARAVQAWLLCGDCGMPPTELLRRVEAAGRFLADEPESMLRIAAARFAAYEDESGMEALHLAYAMLRDGDDRAVVDPLPFLMSEIELGNPEPLAVGRVAAGICLLWATASSETLEYLRADLIDDLRHAGGAAWRGKDGKLLEDIVVELDQRARGGGGGSMSAAAAA